MDVDYYAVLGVSPEAPPEVIRAAYRALAQKHHPDRNKESAKAQETMARINDAYAVLSDPEQRKAYDNTRRSTREATPVSDIPKPPSRSPSTVSVEAVDHTFMLRFIPGQVIDSECWTDTRFMPRATIGMPFMEHNSPRSGAVAVPRQRIDVRTARGDMRVQQTGAHLPVTTGQEVDLIQVVTEDGNRETVVAIVNHSIGRWFWIGSQLAAGTFVRTASAHFVDLILYFSVIALVASIFWASFLRGSDLFVSVVFLFFGLPILFGMLTPLRLRTAHQIGSEIEDRINQVLSKKRSP